MQPSSVLEAAKAFLKRVAEGDPLPQRLEVAGKGPIIRLELGLGVYDVGDVSAVPADLQRHAGILMPEILDKPRKPRNQAKSVQMAKIKALNQKYKSRYSR
jgi:hypothetical protein